MIINSYFTLGGVPALGLTPTINIWEVVTGPPILYNLLVNADNVTSNNSDGFYSYNFTTYDPAKNYIIQVDGGATLPPDERYNIASSEATSGSGTLVQDIVNGVWNEPAASHITSGSMGAYQNETHADIQQLRIDVTTAVSIVTLLLKYEANRTKIDKSAMTLTVYDDDGVTVLKTFNLLDSIGAPSVAEVAERVPV